MDQYAIKVANIYDGIKPVTTPQTFIKELGRIRTSFFRRNGDLERKGFESSLAILLFRRFPKKKASDIQLDAFKVSLASARARLRARRRTIVSVLSEFRRAVEARAVDVFWASRKKHRLRSNPEKIAQALLAVFAKGTIGLNGLVLREISSGIGFVDVGISFGRTLHLVELKIFKGRITGVNQLEKYMEAEGRDRGWLVLIDTRKHQQDDEVPNKIKTASGLIATVLVNVNPPIPHLL